jgi:hypothetical protein
MTTTFDIPMDERTSISVKVNTKHPDGSSRDITGASIVWNATHNGEIVITKSTADATIILGDPVDGRITYFTLTLLPANTDLPDTAEYGTAVVYHHEARLTMSDTKQYLGIRGRMLIMPSQT